jgi:hypothetical protein
MRQAWIKLRFIRCSAGSGTFTVTGLNTGNTVYYLLSQTPPAIGNQSSYDFNVAGSPNNDFVMPSPSSNYFYENYNGTITFSYNYAGPALPAPPANGKFLLASNNASGGNQKAFTLSASTLSGGQSMKGYAYPGNAVSKLSIYDFNGGPTVAVKFKVKMQKASSSAPAGLWAFALGAGQGFSNYNLPAANSSDYFTRIRWDLAASSNAINATFTSGGVNNLATSGAAPFSQNSAAAVELFCNNKAQPIIFYKRKSAICFAPLFIQNLGQ